MAKKYDFSGWATKNDLQCSDGRTIRKDAFKDNDGCTVPLVWNHQHNDSDNVLGHALLENRPNGVYAYCSFNDTEKGRNAKMMVEHGDITGLSIYANKLKQVGGDVLHGAIREVSLVLAGANPGAFIDSILTHGAEIDEEGVIYTGEEIILEHAEAEETSEDVKPEPKPVEKKSDKPKENEMAKERTVQEVIDSMTEEQKNVMYALIGQALEDGQAAHNDENEEDSMKHNVFENENQEEVLQHADIQEALADAKRCGSLKEAFLAHGIDNIDYLFPEAHNLNNPPEFISRRTEWVGKLMGKVHHTPFSRIKSQFADITEDDARAKGYLKGNYKKEEVFSLLKRTTTPTTIYKKQKLDRDDVIDITDFDVVAWIKSEMRGMLDEEIARAILIGDGRLSSSDDKINESNIRPIFNDADLYCIKSNYEYASGATMASKAEGLIDQAVRARKNYKGSGNPVMFTTTDWVTEMLLLKDTNKHRLYKNVQELATAMRVSEIVEVELMENLKDASNRDVAMIIVNPADYNVGADKGGAVNMFDDFDIDYNAQKYLIETRCSGALIKPYSAITVTLSQAA